MTAPKWLPADWPAPPGVTAGTTLRRGGVSDGPYASLNLARHVGDDAEAVARNRARFRKVCNLPAEPRWLNQVHGTTVARAERTDAAQSADAAISDRANTVCAVLTADCLPVLFASADGGEVAAAHAGWRGLCEGILEATTAAFAAAPADILVWLGPAISQPAFEVGSEVRDSFIERDPDAAAAFIPNDRGRWQADLYALARHRLEKSGISRIYGGGRCTFGEPDAFFSWRREAPCGRMASFVFRS